MYFHSKGNDAYMPKNNPWLKKLCVTLVIVLLFSLSACTEEKNSSPIVFRESAVSTIPFREEYILNTSTKKIHKTTCGTAALIHEENRQLHEGATDALLDEGYSFCGNCFK